MKNIKFDCMTLISPFSRALSQYKFLIMIIQDLNGLQLQQYLLMELPHWWLVHINTAFPVPYQTPQKRYFSMQQYFVAKPLHI